MHALRHAVFASFVACGLACVAGAGGAVAQTDPPRVDVALVLSVDASGSIDPDEFQLQKEGIAQAVAAPEVQAAIQSGSHGRIAIAYVEWGSPGGARTMVDWMLVGGAEDAAAFGGAVLAAPRSPQSYNAIGDAIDLAVTLIRADGAAAERAVIDVSGDGPDLRSVRPAAVARAEAVAAGITINALVIDEGRTVGGPGGEPLAEYYAREIIGGPGAFVQVARGYPAFAGAILSKLVREVAGGEDDKDRLLAADGLPR